MRRAERLFRLVNEMRTRPIVRAGDLAAQFEVSLSTIYRDVAHLQASGLPIEGEAGVGYLLRPGFELPNVTFTHDQIDALAVGLAFVENSGDPTLAAAAREARAKLQAGLPDPEARVLADAPFLSLPTRQPPPHSDLLRRAIRQRHVLDIGYTTGNGTPSQRRLWPLLVTHISEGWTISGWCEMRAAFRTFRFDRIQSITDTGERFEVSDTQSLAAFLELEAGGGRADRPRP